MMEEAISCKKEDQPAASMPSLCSIRHNTNFVLKNAVDEVMDQCMLTFAAWCHCTLWGIIHWFVHYSLFVIDCELFIIFYSHMWGTWAASCWTEKYSQCVGIIYVSDLFCLLHYEFCARVVINLELNWQIHHTLKLQSQLCLWGNRLTHLHGGWLHRGLSKTTELSKLGVGCLHRNEHLLRAIWYNHVQMIHRCTKLIGK